MLPRHQLGTQGALAWDYIFLIVNANKSETFDQIMSIGKALNMLTCDLIRLYTLQTRYNINRDDRMIAGDQLKLTQKASKDLMSSL